MSLLNRREVSLLPVFVVGSVLAQGLSLLIIISTYGKIDAIAKAKTPNLVELIDGTTARVVPLPHNERSLVAISNFTSTTFMKLMNWSAISESSALSGIPSPTGSTDSYNFDKRNNQQLDAGIAIGEARVPTSVWAASFALSEDFRATFLSQLAKLIPQGVFTGTTQSLLLVRHLSPPVKIADGQWRQDMIASLVVFESGKQVGKAIAFNKTVFVRSVDTPLLPKNATDLQITAYKARLSGLEIYLIQDYEPNERK